MSPLDQNRKNDYEQEHGHEDEDNKHRGWLGLFGLILVLLGSAALASDWTVLRPNNRPYVTFANVAQFYQFPEYTRVSRTVALRSERRAIRAQAGTSELSINGVRFLTCFPLLNSENETSFRSWT